MIATHDGTRQFTPHPVDESEVFVFLRAWPVDAELFPHMGHNPLNIAIRGGVGRRLGTLGKRAAKRQSDYQQIVSERIRALIALLRSGHEDSQGG